MSIAPAAAPPTPPAASAGARWRRWRWPDSLRAKLFLGIAGVNGLVVVLAYLVNGWSFEQGLVSYLNRADEARLAPLVERLGRDFGARGNWRWLADDHDAWHQVLSETLGVPLPHERAGRPASSPDPRRPDDRPMGWTDGRLLLLDGQRVAQIGSPERVPQALLTPIEVQGQVVGYLGRLPRRELVETLESAVSAQQGRQFAVIALGLLAAVLLNAALIARWLGRRLAVVGAGAAAVAQGDYAVRLPAAGHDELARLTADFNRMAGSLQAAQQARQRWIADIAHELRTPLAGLQAEIEALQDGVRQPTPDRLESLLRQVHRLTRLVGDLRLLSLSDLGALDYRTEPLDLGELVAEVLHESNTEAGGPQLRLDLASGLRVRADAGRLQQVLLNLLHNTQRHCDAPATLSVRLARAGAEAHLVWEDSAPGVAPEDLPRLTDRLYRTDASRARASGGSGLGLAIVRALVEGHGGRLAASASALGGLRWDIFLPLLPDAAHGR